MTTAKRTMTLTLLAALAAAPAAAGANGEHTTGEDAPTRFERFVLSACLPCVREAFGVGAVLTPSLKLPAFPRMPAGAASRPGEILIEVLRAQQLGRPGWQSLALWTTLSVRSAPGGEMYRLRLGLLDASDVPALAQAVAEMAKLATTPMAASVTMADVDFHGGSLRVGLLRGRGESVGYVQAGDVPTLMQRAVWEVPTTLYLPAHELSGLVTALQQAAALIEKVRGN